MTSVADQTYYGMTLFKRLSDWQDRPLLARGDHMLTATQVGAQAAAIAVPLRTAGVRPGDTVVICLRDPIEAMLAFLAVWYLGGAPLVLDFRLRANERVAIFKAVGARLSVVAPGSPGSDLINGLDWNADWAHGGVPAFAPFDGTQNPAFLTTSSGTTGMPKIYATDYAVLTRRSAVREADFPLPQGWAMCAMPLQYIAAIMMVLRNLTSGLPSRFHPVLSSPSELIEALSRHRIVHTSLSPATIRRMTAEVGPRDTPLLDHVRSLRSSGGPAMPEDKIAAYRHLSSGYNMAFGSSLTGFVSVLAGPDILARPETSGRIHKGLKVEAVGLDGQPLPVGEEGTLRIWSDTMIRVVVSHDKSDEVVGDGWCMPGDIGLVDAQGFLTLVGRQADMINRGGVSISAGQIEAAIAGLPGVQQVAVIGVPDAALGQEVAVAVVAPTLDLDSIRRHCLATLAPDKRPRRFALVDSLPHNANGKLLRQKIDAAVFDDVPG